jgi:tetratricopeptide (TPR) repeat protein
MNDVLGSDQLARESYLKASADPAVTPYRVVEALSNFYQRQGQWKEAQGVFDQYQTANPDSTLIPDRIIVRTGEIEPLVGTANDGLAELFFTTASILFGEESSQETFLYLRISLALRPNLPPAQLMLANLYEQMQDYEQAIRIYDSIDPGTVFYRRGQIRKALNYEAMGKKKLALTLLERVAEVNPKDNSALITMGDMLREQERFEEAAGAYTDAIARAEPLKGSDWPLLYARGISFERDGEWGKAEDDFKRALRLEPNQPDVLNYLAYSWLVMNRNVPQAREYLEIAASARPEDAHILDSLGWAHYLSGDYTQAVTHLEKAAELMPDDPTVNEHLGDAYWRVGRTIEAKFQWQRALNFKPDEATAEIIRGKLENGLSPFMEQRSNMSVEAHAAVQVP